MTVVMPFFNQVFDNVEYLADHLRVECGGRLVKEHHIRLHRQCAHDGKALLLAAGQAGCGYSSDFSSRPTRLSSSFAISVASACFSLAQQHRSHGDIFTDGQVREDVEVLEHHAHLLTVLVDVDTLVR